MKNQASKAKGMRDILPEIALRFDHIRRTLRNILELNGFRRIQTPIIEGEDLYASKLQSTSEVFGRETYGFYDRLSKKTLVLRPENTASVVRAVTEHSLLCNGPERFWYDEPMFRRERQQKGRYRQFYQVGVEAFGFGGAEVEAELLVLCERLLGALGLKGTAQLQLNTLGTKSERSVYEGVLLRYLNDHCCNKATCPASYALRPLQALDSKVMFPEEVISCTPQLSWFLSHRSLFRFAVLLKVLGSLGVANSIVPSLVRGIDYYEHTVFEWHLKGTRQALIAGGCYDSLVEQFGSRLGGCGWALGLDRLEEARVTYPTFYADVVLVYSGVGEWKAAHALKRELEDLNLVVVLRPKRNFTRSRVRALTAGCGFLVWVVGALPRNAKPDSSTHAKRLGFQEAASYVVSNTWFE